MANPEVEVLLAELVIGVEPDRTTWLCHATTSATAQVIQQSGVLRSRDGLVYVATHPAIACRIVDPADGVLRLRVAVDDLHVHRRPDELDDRIPQAEFVVYPTSGDEYEPAALPEVQTPAIFEADVVEETPEAVRVAA